MGKELQTPVNLKIVADTEKLIQLCDLLLFASKRTKTSFRLRDISSNLIRVDSIHGPGKTTIRVYPSDRFLNLAAAFLEKQFGFQNTGRQQGR